MDIWKTYLVVLGISVSKLLNHTKQGLLTQQSTVSTHTTAQFFSTYTGNVRGQVKSGMTRARVEPEARNVLICRSGSFLRKRALKTLKILRKYDIISCQLKRLFSCHLQNTTGHMQHRGVIYRMACCMICCCCFTYILEAIL